VKKSIAVILREERDPLHVGRAGKSIDRDDRLKGVSRAQRQGDVARAGCGIARDQDEARSVREIAQSGGKGTKARDSRAGRIRNDDVEPIGQGQSVIDESAVRLDARPMRGGVFLQEIHAAPRAFHGNHVSAALKKRNREVARSREELEHAGRCIDAGKVDDSVEDGASTKACCLGKDTGIRNARIAAMPRRDFSAEKGIASTFHESLSLERKTAVCDAQTDEGVDVTRTRVIERSADVAAIVASKAHHDTVCERSVFQQAERCIENRMNGGTIFKRNALVTLCRGKRRSLVFHHDAHTSPIRVVSLPCGHDGPQRAHDDVSIDATYARERIDDDSFAHFQRRAWHQ